MMTKQVIRFGLLGVLVLALGLTAGWTQQPPDGGGGNPAGGRGFGGPGGFGGGGRGNGGKGGGFDPGMIFDRIANGKATININDMPSRDPSSKERLQQWAAQNGVTNGELTREQFGRYMEERMAAFRANP